MISETSGAAPDDDVAIFKTEAAGTLFARVATEEKCGGQAERDGDDGLMEILFVFVLMQGEASAGFIAIDEAGIGLKVRGNRRIVRPWWPVRRRGRQSGPTGCRYSGSVSE